ncbi:hypothetical protein [Kosakonia sacchari]|uniref:hypothetical protein n=1 Tax=Kosakonia sacchari TaxID=1158459 RepID=UPI0015845BAD|nr:hypothetical protein [Kosakonia sacchari]NUL35047.1 hypothetical protein [Kosakonia sacchari]
MENQQKVASVQEIIGDISRACQLLKMAKFDAAMSPVFTEKMPKLSDEFSQGINQASAQAAGDVISRENRDSWVAKAGGYTKRYLDYQDALDGVPELIRLYGFPYSLDKEPVLMVLEKVE